MSDDDEAPPTLEHVRFHPQALRFTCTHCRAEELLCTDDELAFRRAAHDFLLTHARCQRRLDS